MILILIFAEALALYGLIGESRCLYDYIHDHGMSPLLCSIMHMPLVCPLLITASCCHTDTWVLWQYAGACAAQHNLHMRVLHHRPNVACVVAY
jgi:hypothetical protein